MGDLSTLGSIASELRALAATPSDLLVRGTVVDDQYEIERVLGAGAMGVVYRARDLQLERHVAIKIVREVSPTALARASREAVALARLSHPNVVVIHQVGELAGRVYVAMEYVAGMNGREWAATPRALRDVLRVYLEVGEGLAAAHAAGLVHRDFKPDNVLVGDDGRARVADFGLARSPASADGIASAIDRSTIAGTPAYMAPEQYRDEPIDARADQFAYCTSLWEALHGKRPFGGDSPNTISNATEAGAVEREPERVRKTPRHIDAALRRGLANDRDDRWPSMAPLLAELRRDPRRRRRTIAMVVVAPVLVVAGVFVATRTPTSAGDGCDVGAARITESWGARQAGRLQATFAPPTAPAWDIASLRAAITTTNEWSTRWSDSYRHVCRAGWSATLHDRGMLCLSRAEHELLGTLEALAMPNITATNLDAIVGNLPQPEPCADPSYLEADIPPPSNVAIGGAVTYVEAELQRHYALVLAGQSKTANAILSQLERAPSLGYPPLTAQLHLARAEMMWELEDPKAIDSLEDAYFEARTAGARATAAHAAERAGSWLLEASHDADAAQWGRLAASESAVLDDASVRLDVVIAQANIAIARNQGQHAVELLTAALSTASDHALRILRVRADAYDKLGHYDLALADANEELRLAMQLSEANKPAVLALDQRAMILIHLYRTDEAIAAARAGLAMAGKFDKPTGIVVSTAQGVLGSALLQAQQYDDALGLIDVALAADIAKDGASSYNIASDHNNRCDLLMLMKRERDAIVDCRLAETMWLDTVGKDSVEMALTQSNLSRAEVAIGNTAEALTASANAIRIFNLQPEHPMIFVPLLVHANAELRLEHVASARRDLDAAETYVVVGPERRFELDLARAALEFHDGHLAKAHELAIAARDGYTKLHDERASEAEAAVVRFSK